MPALHEQTRRRRPAGTGRIARMLALAATLLPASAGAAEELHATQTVAVRVETIAAGLDHPWSVEVLPDGAYLVTERPGRLRIIRDGKLSPPIAGLPAVYAGGEGGLFDAALDPDFEHNRRIYLTASVPGGGGQGTAVYAGVLSPDESRLAPLTRIFAMNRFTGSAYHFGSRIAIAPDGSLFFGIGDRGDRDRAQDPADHAGAILHINPDGSPAPGNILAGGTPETWSKGHRNPQGIAFDSADGALYTVEHGARGGDEINQPLAGRNYGWPVITYGKDYSGADIGEGAVKDGYEQPLYYWDPSIAPGAIAVYRGAMFPEWDGDFLVAALKYRLLARLERDDDGKVISEERLFEGEYGRLRDVKVAPDGALLLVTDEDDGALLRVSRAPSP